MRKLFVTFGMLTAMVLLNQASAQQFDPELFKLLRPAQKLIGESPAMLASNEGVQKELKMDEDQIKAVKEKVPSIGGGFGKGGKPSEEAIARFTKMMEKAAQLKDVPEDKLEEKIREVFKEELEGPTKEVEKILKPEQLTRLKQIARQQGGPAAYLKPENVKDLGLKDEQVSKIKGISTELGKDITELFKAGGKGAFSAENREKMAALTKEATEKAEEVLTSEQKTKYKELVVAPYTVSQRFGGGRPTPKPKKDD